MQNVHQDKQSVSDFGLVCALVATGFEIRHTDKKGSRMFFIFSNSSELEQAINEYWAGSLRVGARQYFDATKMLKSRIYGSQL